MRNSAHVLLTACAIIFTGSVDADEPAYDPLAIPKNWKAEKRNLTVVDTDRNREIPVRIYLPEGESPAPVILFSHGLGGSREGNPYLGEHWSARGYVVVYLQHAGSDSAVWKDAPPLRRLGALRKAANLQNTILRFQDVPAVINQLERWNQLETSGLKSQMDLTRIGMSGHSFGAVTTQGVCGQSTPRGATPFTEKRIKAALAMSPNSPKRGGDPKQLFGEVSIPWMLMTGTEDIAPVGDADLESRLAVFPALPPGGKYELVLFGAEHDAFGDRTLAFREKRRNPNHHRVILALSTAYWDAWLQELAPARNWLDGKGPETVLEEQDRWQRK